MSAARSRRILVVASPALGHFFPMVPTLWALRAAGHDVRVAVPAYFARPVLQAGMAVLACSSPANEQVAVEATDGHAEGDRTGTRDVDTHRRFARLARAMGPELEAMVREWAPHAVMSDPVDLAGRRVAALWSLPHVEHRWGLALPEPPRTMAAHDVFGDGCASWPGVGGTRSALTIDPCPPSFQLPDAPPGLPVRFVPFNGPAVVPRWLARRPADRPRILVTAGTVPGDDPGRSALLEGAVAAALGVGAEVVVAADRRSVPPELVDRVRAVQWLPVGLAAATCDLVVHHGGSGTTMSALHCGVPQVVCPLSLDEVDNARRLEELKAGHTAPVSGPRWEPELRSAVEAVLGDPRYTENARSLQAEMTAAPPLAVAAARVAEAATTRG